MHAGLDSKASAASSRAADIRRGRVVLERPDGSGVVEIPLSSVASDYWSRADFEDMVANFQRTTGVIAGVTDGPHLSLVERAGYQPARIAHLELRGDELWGRVDMRPELFARRAGYHGFSLETVRGEGIPEAWEKYAFAGWVIVGGIFTNRPATDTAFELAASIKPPPTETAAYGFIPFRPLADGGPSMSETSQDPTVQLAAALAEVKSTKAALETYATDLATAREDSKGLREQLTAAQAEARDAIDAKTKATGSTARLEADIKERDEQIARLEGDLRASRTKVKELESTQTGVRVIQLSREAIRAGVPPSFFGSEGLKSVERDPCAWLSGRFASVEALQDVLKVVPKTASLSGVRSGVGPEHDDSEPVIDRDRAAALKRMGLDPSYAHVTNQSELEALNDKRKQAGS